MKAAQIAHPTATKPAEGKARMPRTRFAPEPCAGRGRVLRALRAVFFWRVRFSLRTLLLLAAGIGACLGAKMTFDENPWQQTWRWNTPPGGKIASTCFSPDGRRISAVVLKESEPTKNYIFEAPAPDPIAVVHLKRSMCLSFLEANSKLFACYGGLRDVESGLSIDPPTGEVVCVSADGQTAVTEGKNNATFQVWDLGQGTRMCDVENADAWLDGPVLTPAGLRGLTVHHNWTSHVDLWDLERGVVLDRFDDDRAIRYATVSQDGNWLLLGGYSFAVLWDVARHRAVRQFDKEGRFINGTLSSGGRRVVFYPYFEALSWDHTRNLVKLPLWDLERNALGGTVVIRSKLVHLLLPDQFHPMASIGSYETLIPHFSIDGSRVIGFDDDAGISVQDTETGKTICKLEGDSLSPGQIYCQPLVAGTSDAVLVHDENSLVRFERVRPEGPERLYWLPEFWLAAFFALALLFSFWRDGRRLCPS